MPLRTLVALAAAVATAWTVSAHASPTAPGARLDCAKATHRVDRTVCRTPSLRKLDLWLSWAFEHAHRDSSDPAPLRADQQAWLRATRAQCRDAACIEAAWRRRIVRLGAWNRTVPLDDQVFGSYRFSRDNEVYDGGRHAWVPARTSDCMTIDRRPEGLGLKLSLVQSQANMCHLDGRLEAADGELVYVPDPAEPDLAECRLRVRFKRETIVLHDPDQACRAWACAALAGIDGVEFPRAGRSARRCDG